MANRVHTTSDRDIDIEIKELTLLTKEEYEEYRDIIEDGFYWWWLRTPHTDPEKVAVVYSRGGIGNFVVTHDCGGVRPVLRFSSSEISSSETGEQCREQFWLGGKTWTVISPYLALCDECIDFTAFNRDREYDMNIYEGSNVQKWLENWAQTENLEIQADDFHLNFEEVSRAFEEILTSYTS